MITVLIVDDEEHNRSVLRTLLGKHCSDLTIVDEAKDSEDAFLKINKHRPQLIFLDVKMPKKSGFDLLRRFPEIDFEVIFVTAFNRYAIKAFEFNAVGYILKPIDITKLKTAVGNARERILSGSLNNVALHFVQTLSDKNELMAKLSVHHNDKVIFIALTDVSFIQSFQDHTKINLHDNTHYYSSKDLCAFEEALESNMYFIRINKSVIINTSLIKSYSKGEVCVVDMQDGSSFEVSRRRKTEILKLLKSN